MIHGEGLLYEHLTSVGRSDVQFKDCLSNYVVGSETTLRSAPKPREVLVPCLLAHFSDEMKVRLRVFFAFREREVDSLLQC